MSRPADLASVAARRTGDGDDWGSRPRCQQMHSDPAFVVPPTGRSQRRGRIYRAGAVEVKLKHRGQSSVFGLQSTVWQSQSQSVEVSSVVDGSGRLTVTDDCD